VIDALVVAQRVELAGRHLEDGGVLERLLDPHVVAAGERADFGGGAVYDDVDGLRTDGQVIRQVGAQPRAMRGIGRRSAPQHQGGDGQSRRRVQELSAGHA
jgi:hypothetical protein